MRADNRGAPDPQRLQAAVDRVVSRIDPDQIVLFGSAARGEMTDESDLDLLVIAERENEDGRTRQETWEARNGRDYDVDIVMMNRTTAEAWRHSTTRIQGAALQEGRTVYARNGVEALETGPAYFWNGHEMVKETRFEPDEANRLLESAADDWLYANDKRTSTRSRCRQLQSAMEYALKALTVAQGRRVKHKHDLNELWDDVERHGERIAATRDRKALDVLTLYSGKMRYESPTRETDPDETWNATRTACGDVLDHARARVPKLITETTERLRRPQGGTEPQ